MGSFFLPTWNGENDNVFCRFKSSLLPFLKQNRDKPKRRFGCFSKGFGPSLVNNFLVFAFPCRYSLQCYSSPSKTIIRFYWSFIFLSHSIMENGCFVSSKDYQKQLSWMWASKRNHASMLIVFPFLLHPTYSWVPMFSMAFKKDRYGMNYDDTLMHQYSCFVSSFFFWASPNAD